MVTVTNFRGILRGEIGDLVHEVITEVSDHVREEIYQEARVNVGNGITNNIRTMVEYDIHRYSNSLTYDNNK